MCRDVDGKALQMRNRLVGHQQGAGSREQGKELNGECNMGLGCDSGVMNGVESTL